MNKPVAWIEPDVIPLTYIIKAVVRREQDEQYSIPLYTHPAELTDEEITICMGSLPKYNSEIVDEDLIKFARAILRKAQEK